MPHEELRFSTSGSRSDEERASNIRRLTEQGKIRAKGIAQQHTGFLAIKEAMHRRIARDEAEQSRRTREEAQIQIEPHIPSKT